jgi:hypothetical protein
VWREGGVRWEVGWGVLRRPLGMGREPAELPDDGRSEVARRVERPLEDGFEVSTREKWRLRRGDSRAVGEVGDRPLAAVSTGLLPVLHANRTPSRGRQLEGGSGGGG